MKVICHQLECTIIFKKKIIQSCTNMMNKSNDGIYYVLRGKKTGHQSSKLKVNVFMLLE